MRVHGDLEGVIRSELDDCEPDLKRDDVEKALRELDDAINKFQDIVRRVRRLSTFESRD